MFKKTEVISLERCFAEFSKLSNEELEKLVKDSHKNIIKLLAIINVVIHRNLYIKPYLTQNYAAFCLYKENIIEMSTGEGKSLTICIAVLLHLLTSKHTKIHILTVNNYLARRDSKYFKKIYSFFGYTSNYLDNDNVYHENSSEKYNSNVLYGSIDDFIFHFLNKSSDFKEVDGLFFDRQLLIIDEIDQIIIDYTNAFVLSRSFMIKDQNIEIFRFLIKQFYKLLKNDDFKVDYKYQFIYLQYPYWVKLSKFIELNNINRPLLFSFLCHKYLIANLFIHKNQDYIVDKKQIAIISEHSSRVSVNTSYDDLLQCALEIKEDLPLSKQSFNITLSSILFNTFANYYKSYVGLSGTILSESIRLNYLKSHKVIKIPDRSRKKLKVLPEKICNNVKEKLDYIRSSIDKNTQLRPIIVICKTIEQAELLYNNLLNNKSSKYKVNLLTPKNVEEEDIILTNAGKLGNVTITTFMCARGVDIVLGGQKEYNEYRKNKYYIENNSNDNTELDKQIKTFENNHETIVKLGGMLLIVFEHANITRIDDQIKGRVARQNNPGTIIFLISKDDELFREFDFLKYIITEDIVYALQKKYENTFFRNILNNFALDQILDYFRRSLLRLASLKLIQIYHFFNVKDYKKHPRVRILQKFKKGLVNQNFREYFVEIIGKVWNLVVYYHFEILKLSNLSFLTNENTFILHKINIIKFFRKLNNTMLMYLVNYKL